MLLSLLDVRYNYNFRSFTTEGAGKAVMFKQRLPFIQLIHFRPRYVRNISGAGGIEYVVQNDI